MPRTYSATRTYSARTYSGTRSYAEKNYGYDPIAFNYFVRQGITDNTERNAENTFIAGLRSAALLGKCYGLWIASPTGYGAGLGNVISPNFMLSSSAAPNYSTAGWSFDGASQFLNTNIIPATHFATIDNVTCGFRSRTAALSSGGQIDMGVSSSASSQLYFSAYRSDGNARMSAYTNASLFNAANTTGAGNFFYNVRGATDREIRRDTTQLGTSAAAHVGTNPTHAIYLGARNNVGVADMFSARVMTVAYVFTALSAAECNTLSGLLNTLDANIISGGR